MKHALLKIANGRIAGIIVAAVFLMIFAVLFIGYNALQIILLVGLTIGSAILICLILWISPLLIMDFLNQKRAIKKG